jgi:hypothetical protein
MPQEPGHNSILIFTKPQKTNPQTSSGRGRTLLQSPRPHVFFREPEMFSTGTHEERLMERTVQAIYEGKTLASILTSLNWRDRMTVLKNETKLLKFVQRFREIVGES